MAERNNSPTSRDVKLPLLDFEGYADIFADLKTGWSPVTTPGSIVLPSPCEPPSAVGDFPAEPHRLSSAGPGECSLRHDQSNNSSDMEFETHLGTADPAHDAAHAPPRQFAACSPPQQSAVGGHSYPATRNSLLPFPMLCGNQAPGSVITRRKDEAMGGIRFSITSAPRPVPHLPPKSSAVTMKPTTNAATRHAPATAASASQHALEQATQSDCGEGDLLASFVRNGRSAGIDMESIMPDVISGLRALEQEGNFGTKITAPGPNTVAGLHQSLSLGTFRGSAQIPPYAAKAPSRSDGAPGNAKTRVPRRAYSSAGPGTNRPPKEGSVSAQMPKDKLSRKRAAARRYYHNQKNKVYEHEEVVRNLEDENQAIAEELQKAIKKLELLKQSRVKVEGC